MQNKYYYLVASLPSLQLEAEVPISTKDFLTECKKWLTSKDMKILLAANIKCIPSECEETPLLSQWKEFDQVLREELALARAARKKNEEDRGSEQIKHIFSQETPLLSEQELEGIRWRFLEEKAHGYFFNLSWLIIYYLELQIIERLAAFNKDKGEKYFYALCEVDYEKAIG